MCSVNGSWRREVSGFLSSLRGTGSALPWDGPLPVGRFGLAYYGTLGPLFLSLSTFLSRLLLWWSVVSVLFLVSLCTGFI